MFERFDQHSLLPIGTLLQMGKYRIDSYLSSGGFGNTYVITNLQFDEQFAMKEFFMKGINERDDDSTTVSVSNKDNNLQFEQQRVKFKKEARRLRKLNNRHIVHVHDLFDENGTTYYVMDLIDGQSISNIMRQTGSSLSEEKALNIVRQVLEALDVVHKEKIWHLDLKPGNIMLNKKGDVVVIDFGASKQLSSNEGYTSTSAALCYTPGYAPSEQIDQNMQKIGPWTDLYALGATLYNMLTMNQPPSVSEIIDGNAFRFSNAISEKSRQLICWMMMPSRQKRPQSIADVRSYIENHEIINRDPPPESEDTVYGKGNDTSEETVYGNGFLTDKEKVIDHKNEVLVFAILFTIIVVVLGLLVFKGNDANKKGTVKLPQKKELSIRLGIIDSIRQDNQKVANFYETVKFYSGDNAVSDKTCSSPLGMYTYTGPTDEQGVPNGIGIAVFTDGRLYVGVFYHGKLQGDSYFRYTNGDTFEGDFSNNSFSNGRYNIYSDGSYFIGTFKNGQPKEGQWFDKNGNMLNQQISNSSSSKKHKSSVKVKPRKVDKTKQKIKNKIVAI